MESTRDRWGDVWLLALVLLVFAAHASAGFVYDDLALIQGNPRVTGAAGLGEALAGSFWGFESADAEGAVGYWRPLTVLVLRWTYALASSALAFHLVSLALHVLAVWTARRVAVLWLGSKPWAWVAAAVFAVHPLQVEPVAWAAALSDVLVGLFALLALERLTRWSRARQPRELVGFGLAFLAALASKEQALFLVPVFALVLRLKPGGATRSVWLTAGACLAVYVAARGLVFGDWLAGFDRANSELGLTTARALLFRVEAFGTFLAMLLLVELPNPFRAVAPSAPWDTAGLWIALAACLAWLIAAVGVRRSRLGQLVVWSLPFTFAAILIAPNNAGQFPISDRYVYLATFCFGVGLSALVRHMAQGRCTPRAALNGARVLVLAGALVAFAHVPRWHSDADLFRAAVAQNPSNPFVHWSLGRALLERYQRQGARDDLHAAHLHFLVSRGIGRVGYQDELWRDDAESFATRASGYRTWLAQSRTADTGAVWRGANDLLQALLGQGYCELELALLEGRVPVEAQALFAQCVQRFPNDARSEVALANALYAEARLRDGAPNLARSAREHVRAALALNPALPEAWQLEVKLGALLGDDAAVDAALAELTERTGPPVALLLEAARAAANRGASEPAERYLAAIPPNAPQALEARYVAAVLAAQAGDPETARAALEALAADAPDHLGARLTLAQLHLGAGRTAAALDAYRAATDIRADSFEAWLGRATLAKQLATDDLAPALVGAYRTSPPGDNRRALVAELERLPSLTEAQLDALRTAAVAHGASADLAAFKRLVSTPR